MRHRCKLYCYRSTYRYWHISTHAAVIYHLQHISRDEGNTFTATCWQIIREKHQNPINNWAMFGRLVPPRDVG